MCNCRLNAFMSCIKQCVNESKCHRNSNSKMNFVATDSICLITAQMSYSNWLIKCKHLTQMIMHNFWRNKNCLIVKITIKGKIKTHLNLLENINFYHCCDLTTTLYILMQNCTDIAKQARAEGGGGGGRRVLEHLPLCPKCPFVKAIIFFFLLNTLLWRPAQSNY